MKKILRSTQKWLKCWMVIFIFLASILFAYGFIHIREIDRPIVIPKQDLETHRFDKFGKSLSILVTAYLKPDYNVIYAYERTPISLTLEFQKCDNCPELENGLTFWFYYEKINGSGSGGSIVSSSPDNLYKINIKPGEKKEIEGWVQFTGEGIFRHALWNSTYNIKLETTERTVTVYANHIAYQIRSSIVIESFSAFAVGVSCIMLIFICFQMYSNIENRIEREKELKKLLSKLDEIKPVISSEGSKHKNSPVHKT